jgi:uncharacterized protein YabE (DUF348 family)
MRSILKKPPLSYRLFIAGFCLLFMLVGLIVTTGRAQAASQLQPTSGKRLITIHDNGQDKAILTDDSTLRQAFKDAHIRIDASDMVEPGLDDVLVASNYEVNIYRARPVTIIDGAIRERVMSAYRTAEQIVSHAGMVLHDEDRTSMGITTNMVSDGAGVQLRIERATPVMFVLYGKKTPSYTQAATVGEMLKEKGITLAKNDTLSVSLSTRIIPNIKIELWRNGTQTFTDEQDVPFDTEQIQDADQPVGYKLIKTPGVNGKRTVTYEIVMKNGQEVSRKEIQSVVTAKPSSQVEVIGTKADLPPGSHEDWMAAAGISASDYGYVNYIVSHEGGWEPCKVQGGAIDCSYSGYIGYGMVQATPGGKMVSAGSDWRTNPITQLRWATGYAARDYGSWEGAYNHWMRSHNW